MGYSNAYVNTSINSFQSFINNSLSSELYKLDDNDFYWIWSGILNIWFFGFIIGTWCSVPILENYGRKYGLIISNSGTIFSISIMTLSISLNSITLLFIGRFLSSIFSGIAMSSVIIFLQEISPNHLKGAMSFYGEFAFVLTNEVGAFFGLPNILGSNIKYLIAFSGIPVFIGLILSYLLPETPEYLIEKEVKMNDILKSLKFYQGISDDKLISKITTNKDDERKFNISEIKNIFRNKKMFKKLILGLLSLQLTCSIWGVIYYSTEFLIKAGIDLASAQSYSTYMLLLSALSTCIGLFIVEKFSRRSFFLHISSLNILALFIFWLCDQSKDYFDIEIIKYGCVGALFLHGITYSISTGPIAWFILAELFEIKYRSAAQSIALSINQFIAFLLTFFILPLYNVYGSHVLLFLFVIPSIFCLYYLYKYLPETKNENNVEERNEMLVLNDC
uniref:MFS domain-containing protein n=1 Tax=Parastrongyloides trichosuri TaxID=131310 RepID=A0A0N5A2F0_PARTI